MAKFICCYSGLEITTSHFPLYLSSRDHHQACHPIFHAPQKSLLSYARKWSAHELTLIDSYLLYIALLKSTDLVFFRTSCRYISRDTAEEEKQIATDSIIASNMEYLMRAIGHINIVSNPHVRFPEIVITSENCNLWTSRHWIDNWNKIYADFREGIRNQELLARMNMRDSALEKMIRSPHKRIEFYSKDLAEWADDVVQFPRYEVFDKNLERKIPLNEYYKEIIMAACSKEYHKIHTPDLYDVIKLCANEIEFSIEKGENKGGTIQSHLLFKVLQDAETYLDAFIKDTKARPITKIPIKDTWKFPDDINSLGFSAPEEDDNYTDEDEFIPGINALVENTPDEKPDSKTFTSKLEYLKAKIKWDSAQSILARKKEKKNQQITKLNLGF